MAFGPGLHVFPGGALDPADADARLLERLRPPLDGDPAGVHGAPFVVAAIREAWEEAGILLGTPAGTRGPVDGSWRFPTAAEAGQVPFLDLVVEHDVELRGDWLVPLSRWVTPPVVPRRYDARFFVAWLPDGAQLVFDEREVVGHEWLRPADALAAMACRADRAVDADVGHAPGAAGGGVRRRPAGAGAGRSRDAASLDGGRRERRPGGRDPDRRRGRRPGRRGPDVGRGPRRSGRRRPGRPLGRGRRRDPRGDRVARWAGACGARDVAPTRRVAAGGEGMALRLGVPLLGPFDAERLLAADVSLVEVDDLVAAGDVTLRVVPAPDGRADAVGYRIEGTGIVLGGERPD